LSYEQRAGREAQPLMGGHASPVLSATNACAHHTCSSTHETPAQHTLALLQVPKRTHGSQGAVAPTAQHATAANIPAGYLCRCSTAPSPWKPLADPGIMIPWLSPKGHWLYITIERQCCSERQSCQTNHSCFDRVPTRGESHDRSGHPTLKLGHTGHPDRTPVIGTSPAAGWIRHLG
jgi:hypothetical protein